MEVESYQIREVGRDDDRRIFQVPSRDHPTAYGVGDTIHWTFVEAEKQVSLNRAFDRQDELRAAAGIDRKADDARKQNEARDIDGFAAGETPMKRGRIVSTLKRSLILNGRLDSRQNHIKRLVSEGYTISGAYDHRRLQGLNGRYFTKKDITATAMDYAEFLLQA